MSTTDSLVGNAGAYADGFDKGGLAAPPGKKVAIITCMDARVNPYGIFGLTEGDAHLIRNAGGIVNDDTIRSLAISQHLLGTEEVIVIHHTDCGMLSFTDEEFAAKLEQEAGERPGWSGGAFADLEQDVRDSVAALKASPFIPKKDNIRGFVFDVGSGKVRELS